jgi:uncharacterized RDD family membrane protein YckC
VNPPQAQSDCESQYFDPEAPDMSEQQFSASVDSTTSRPSFVVDTQEYEDSLCQGSDTLPRETRATEQPRNSALGEVEGGVPVEIRSTGSTFVAIQEDVLSSLTPGESSGSDSQDTTAPAAEPDIPKVGVSSTLSSPAPAEDPDWRGVVSAKVNSYRSRKPRRDRFPSLQLRFEPSVRKTGLAEAALDSPLSQFAAIESSQPEVVQVPASIDATARVLEFPRSAALPVHQDELAEPMLDRPRIVEAPELQPPPPALGGILIESTEEPAPERRKGFDLPLQTASLSRRILAGAADGVMVLVALAVLGCIVTRIAGPLPPRLALETAFVFAAILWAAYQYAFLVFSGTTPGLRVMRLSINRFDGSRPSRSLRRWRVSASYLSFISLALGYLWCFLDEDQLSWHDRITKTHLGPDHSSAR